MRAFRLQHSVTLDTRPASPQLVDSLSGRAVALSPTERSVVQALGAGCTSEALLERLRERGVPVARRELSVFISRLAAAGMLEVEGVPTPHPVPMPLAQDDAVPRLRTDLVYKPAARAGLIEVRDLRAGRSFTLFEFEMTIARMFDGRHTLEQVAAATGRLGVKATVETLRSFVRQLDGYGFLQRGEPPAPRRLPVPTPAPASAPSGWSPELREMYEFALGHARSHHYDEAVQYLVALLDIDGTLREAKALLEEVQARREATAGLDFQVMHGAPPPPPSIPPVIPTPVPAPLETAQAAPARGRAPKPPPPPGPTPVVHVVGESLPPMWTVETVARTVSDGDEHVLPFDRRRGRDAAPAPATPRAKERTGR